ncbi:AAA family ATPase [Deinococcus cellulosilyticus]|uniref:Uncharacterized protein n=1 Tax=Deinococcus cellulosilyticus (strain DSM 18568 / NBRC 106333 / KACC 11606 / 5516J-15) TaxID=1223518 RepID=A0A511MZ65_DEIC1|nr:AAA family ATPase [Deinococcus cellulosilyticus]GEM45884.1 hypothetical protein DC3_15190 [Deinococcus cellulosilyticus NBRC 106333 = KACC 11606]
MVSKLTHLTGIGETHAARIIKHLGNGSESRALDRIESNPYDLIQVPRIGFKTADRIALTHYRLRTDNPDRHFAGNQYLLEQEGSLPERDYLSKRQALGLTENQHQYRGVEQDSGRVWYPSVLEAEKKFAEWVVTCLELPSAPRPLPPLRATAEEAAYLEELDPIQQRAALTAIHGSMPCLTITGGAGTGKTRVIAAIAKLAELHEIPLAVSAFAGKAADRVRESLELAGVVPEYSGTIHRMLGYRGNGGFADEKLAYKIIIIDEASMVETRLLWHVVRAMTEGARLILVGDDGQLPPVGFGQPFKDLISLGAPRVHLEKNYRQRDQLGIIDLAHHVRTGKVLHSIDPTCVDLQVSKDISTITETLLESLAGQNVDDWQLITWKNEDAEAMNVVIQDIVNPTGFPLMTYRVFGAQDQVEIRSNDKVMVRQNDYDLGIFNGQLGTALDTRLVTIVQERQAESLEDHAIADDDGIIREKKDVLCLLVRIGGEIVNIPLEDASELIRLGYAITVHKAQGSDWNRVIIFQTCPVAFDAQRWWYTSVTRAKSMLHIYYADKALGNPLLRWWMNAHRTMHDGPSILVGRIKKLKQELDQKGFLKVWNTMTEEARQQHIENLLS